MTRRKESRTRERRVVGRGNASVRLPPGASKDTMGLLLTTGLWCLCHDRALTTWESEQAARIELTPDTWRGWVQEAPAGRAIAEGDPETIGLASDWYHGGQVGRCRYQAVRNALRTHTAESTRAAMRSFWPRATKAQQRCATTIEQWAHGTGGTSPQARASLRIGFTGRAKAIGGGGDAEALLEKGIAREATRAWVAALAPDIEPEGLLEALELSPVDNRTLRAQLWASEAAIGLCATPIEQRIPQWMQAMALEQLGLGRKAARAYATLETLYADSHSEADKEQRALVRKKRAQILWMTGEPNAMREAQWLARADPRALAGRWGKYQRTQAIMAETPALIGRIEAALAEHGRAVAVAGGDRNANADARIRLARSFEMASMHAKALSLALEYAPNREAEHALAILAFDQMERLETAPHRMETQARRALQAKPGSAKAKVRLGLAHALQSRKAQAVHETVQAWWSDRRHGTLSAEEANCASNIACRFGRKSLSERIDRQLAANRAHAVGHREIMIEITARRWSCGQSGEPALDRALDAIALKRSGLCLLARVGGDALRERAEIVDTPATTRAEALRTTLDHCYRTAGRNANDPRDPIARSLRHILATERPIERRVCARLPAPVAHALRIVRIALWLARDDPDPKPLLAGAALRLAHLVEEWAIRTGTSGEPSEEEALRTLLGRRVRQRERADIEWKTQRDQCTAIHTNGNGSGRDGPARPPRP